MQPRARVIKVKRRDLEAAISQGDLEEYEDENDKAAETASVDQAPSAPGRVSSLSSAEEDELARELAALEADMTPSDEGNGSGKLAEEDDGEDSLFALDDAEDELAEEDENDNIVADSSDDAPDMPLERSGAAKPAREALPALGEDSGADMNRLMNETESQMGEPGNATRRDAFARLANFAANVEFTFRGTDPAQVEKREMLLSKWRRINAGPVGSAETPLDLVTDEDETSVSEIPTNN